jgi:hypothetical protein
LKPHPNYAEGLGGAGDKVRELNWNFGVRVGGLIDWRLTSSDLTLTTTPYISVNFLSIHVVISEIC